jgi:hypothetical protein
VDYSVFSLVMTEAYRNPPFMLRHFESSNFWHKCLKMEVRRRGQEWWRNTKRKIKGPTRADTIQPRRSYPHTTYPQYKSDDPRIRRSHQIVVDLSQSMSPCWIELLLQSNAISYVLSQIKHDGKIICNPSTEIHIVSFI